MWLPGWHQGRWGGSVCRPGICLVLGTKVKLGSFLSSPRDGICLHAVLPGVLNLVQTAWNCPASASRVSAPAFLSTWDDFYQIFADLSQLVFLQGEHPEEASPLRFPHA